MSWQTADYDSKLRCKLPRSSRCSARRGDDLNIVAAGQRKTLSLSALEASVASLVQPGTECSLDSDCDDDNVCTTDSCISGCCSNVLNSTFPCQSRSALGPGCAGTVHEINLGAWDVKGEYEDTMHASGGSCSAGAGKETLGGTRDSRVKAFGISDYTTVMLRKEDGFHRMLPSHSASVAGGWNKAITSHYDDVPMQKVG